MKQQMQKKPVRRNRRVGDETAADAERNDRAVRAQRRARRQIAQAERVLRILAE